MEGGLCRSLSLGVCTSELHTKHSFPVSPWDQEHGFFSEVKSNAQTVTLQVHSVVGVVAEEAEQQTAVTVMSGRNIWERHPIEIFLTNIALFLIIAIIPWELKDNSLHWLPAS